MLLNEFNLLKLYNGHLPVENILNQSYSELKHCNLGAIINFIGVIRNEDNIDGLSFDIYMPILDKWFNKWKRIFNEKNAVIQMFHSIGDVKLSQSSFIVVIASSKRRIALELIDLFVEDFKANAPIWKYDIKDGKRIYAKERSLQIKNSGLLN